VPQKLCKGLESWRIRGEKVRYDNRYMPVILKPYLSETVGFSDGFTIRA